MKRLTLVLLLICSAAALSPRAAAQNFAIKTNLLYDALANINLGLEAKVAPRFTVDVNGNFNNWSFEGGKRWKHWMVQPELRYWFCEAMNGNFVALELHTGQYNIGKVNLPFSLFGTDFAKLKDTRYQGWYAGAGLTYGHAWMLARNWNFEAEIGIGWSYTRFDHFPCTKCGDPLETDATHNYFGLTKAALNIVYIF